MKENLLAKMTRKMDIPTNIITSQPKIVITGFRDIFIDNHQGLLEYGEQEVHINCGEAVLRLVGEGFVIRAMTARELRLEGLIFSVGFEY